MKRFILMLAMSLLVATTAFGQKSKSTSESDGIEVTAAQLADSLISDAKKYLGRPYVWGADGPNAFDCSGFTRFIYGKLGYKIGRTVLAQMEEGRIIKGKYHELQKGDLIIFGSRANKARPGHVGIFIELDTTLNSFTFIHASVKGVVVAKSSTKYYKDRFLRAVRILPDFAPPAPEKPMTVEQIDSIYSEIVVPPVELAVPDTLKLTDEDKRIILFKDGTWAYVGEDGVLTQPIGDKIDILYGNGTWKNMPVSTKKIPEYRYVKPTATPAPQTSSTPVRKYHTVKEGDMLSYLAVKYDTTVSAICRLNNITDTAVLKIGMKLRVK